MNPSEPHPVPPPTGDQTNLSAVSGDPPGPSVTDAGTSPQADSPTGPLPESGATPAATVDSAVASADAGVPSNDRSMAAETSQKPAISAQPGTPEGGELSATSITAADPTGSPAPSPAAPAAPAMTSEAETPPAQDNTLSGESTLPAESGGGEATLAPVSPSLPETESRDSQAPTVAPATEIIETPTSPVAAEVVASGGTATVPAEGAQLTFVSAAPVAAAEAGMAGQTMTASSGEVSIPPVAEAEVAATTTSGAQGEETPSAVTPSAGAEGPASVAAEATEAAAEGAAPTPPAVPPQPIPPVPPAPQPHELARIAQDLQIRKSQVEAVLQLLDEHYAPPFIARYRKDQTGGLDEDTIRRIQQRVRQLREIAARKQSILRTLAHQHRLTDELTQAILQADSLRRLDDLFLPYRTRKKSLAKEARDKGLGPVAEAIWQRDPAVIHLDEVLPGLVDPDKWLLTTEDVLNGIKLILKETIAEQADLRGEVRKFMWDTGVLVAQRSETLPEGKGKEFQPYFDFKEPVREIPPHRVLAINRGERLHVLRVRVDVDRSRVIELALQKLPLADHPHRDLLMSLVPASVEEILLPALEREVRRELLERAQEHAVQIFARNLRSLLLQPPVRGKKVLAIDPNNKTAATVVALDEQGNYIEDVILPLAGAQRNPTETKLRLEQLIRRHQISLIAIGNGGNYREVEALVAELIAELERGGGKSAASVAAASVQTPAAGTPSGAGTATAASVGTAGAAPSAGTTAAAAATLPAGGVVLTSESLTGLTATPTGSVTAASIPVPAVTFTATMAGEVVSWVVSGPAGPAIAAGGGAASAGTPASPQPGATPTPAETVARAETTQGTSPVAVPPTPARTPIPLNLEGLPPAPSDLAYVTVLEAGIRDYASSPIAQEEFPTLSAPIRAAISIGRRLLDPLAELVKIEPHHIGVGLYQHDVRQKTLKEALEAVIVSCVNTVGVDLNRAEFPLLRHVCGLNPTLAREIVTRRRQQGPFRQRRQLLEIAGLSEKNYTQAAGFVRILQGEEPLDETWVHPEQYDLARALLEACGFTPADLRDPARLADLVPRLAALAPADFAARFQVSEGTVRDVIDALTHPGRDPRLDHPPPIFKRGMLKFEDIRPGMELRGTVLNVVPFGAFIDIGLRESGLVHISQMANRYIRSPYEVVSVGDVVTVWVLEVKPEARKISLTMIPPGQERRAATSERPAAAERRSRREGGATSAETRAGVSGEGRPSRPRSAPRGGPAPSGSSSGTGRSGPARTVREPRSSRGPRPTAGPAGTPASSAAAAAPPAASAPASTGPSAVPAPPSSATGETTVTPPTSGPASPSAAPAGSAASTSALPAGPRRSPAKPPAKPRPLPTLSPEKRSGKAALNTFAELAAYFKQQEESSVTGDNGTNTDSSGTGSPSAGTKATEPPSATGSN